MDQETRTLIMYIAGLQHDIGKFATEDRLPVSETYFRNNADLYLPFYNGRHTHRHALLTAAFIEQMADRLPAQLASARPVLGESFVNLAAGHHRPETPLQWIVAMADRISSGWDRVEFDEKYNRAVRWQDYQKTRLIPLFDKLLTVPGQEPKSKDDFDYVYPLRPLSPVSIFARDKKQEVPGNKEQALAQYQELFAMFVDALDGLAHRNDNLELWLDHFDSLLMRYTWAVPAARAGQVIPDVSLYDHLKSTAALAAALYLYHSETDTLDVDAVRSERESKFLVVAGDFYGVQKFIFSDSGEARRNRSKILRGRSFAVSLFAELGADLLCRQIGLPSPAVVLQAGAKFVLIAPNLARTRDAVDKVQEELNRWLTTVNFGESAMGLVAVEAAPADFTRGRFVNLWDRMAYELNRKKYQKLDLDQFGGCFASYLDGFRNDLARPLCPLCGRRPSHPDVEGSSYLGDVTSACKLCRDHIMLGENLVKRSRIAVVRADTDFGSHDRKLLEPILGRYQVVFTDDPLTEAARSGALLKYWHVGIAGSEEITTDLTVKFINGYVPVYGEEDHLDPRVAATLAVPEAERTLRAQIGSGAPKTFEHIACRALFVGDDGSLYGNPALGILKADVDHLGMIMSCGLPRERFTLSRLATMSRSLNNFFALFLPHHLAVEPDYENVYTVFAGGDDLFLIGPWWHMLRLAEDLNDRFSEYVCRNGEIHLSAGIALAKPHVPLDRLAQDAEAALEKAKHGGRNRINVFGETIGWDRFHRLQKEVRPTLQRWIEADGISRGMLYRLNDFIAMAEREQQLRRQQRFHLDEMECLKWRAMFTYLVQRNVGRGLPKETRSALQAEFEHVARWLDAFGGSLRIALWEVLYNMRKRRV